MFRALQQATTSRPHLYAAQSTRQPRFERQSTTGDTPPTKSRSLSNRTLAASSITYDSQGYLLAMAHDPRSNFFGSTDGEMSKEKISMGNPMVVHALGIYS